ncbi:MAG: hypothetical protein U0L56_01900 [Lachnospiraceae bacterium]|nr:hypothetical protein [Lachnospiraceae bacterium]
MITDMIINIIYKCFMFVLGGYTPLTFNIDVTFYRAISDFISFIFYIIPIDGLKPMITFIVAITVFRIVVSVIKTIWDLLPLL